MFNKFIDIAQIMRDLKKRPNTNINRKNDSTQEMNFYVKEWEWRKQDLLNYRGQIEFHKNIGMRVPQFLTFNRWTRKTLKILSKIINKASFIITRDQNIVNNHVLLSIDRLRESVELLLGKTHDLENTMHSKIEHSKTGIEANIKDILEGYLTKEQVKSNIKDTLQDYFTKEQVEASIKDILEGYFTKEEIEKSIKELSQVYLTEGQVLEICNIESERIIDKFKNSELKESIENTILLKNELEYIKSKNETLANNIDQLRSKYNNLEMSYEDTVKKIKDIDGDSKKAISRINQKINRLSSLPMKRAIQEGNQDNIVNLQSHQIYRDFEDRFRGNESEIKGRLKTYIDFLQKHEFSSFSKCLDLGCGRGEWLQLLEENGYDCLGIDINSEFVDMCKAKGLNVILDDILNYVKSIDDSSYDVISGFHIIEHILYDDLNSLISEINRVLKPGGIVIFETPNPQNITVGACNFYTDSTHIRPVHPEGIRFQLEYFGFYDVEYLFWQKDRLENSEEIRTSIINSNLDSNIKQLLLTSNTWFNAPGDFGVIGRKA